MSATTNLSVSYGELRHRTSFSPKGCICTPVNGVYGEVLSDSIVFGLSVLNRLYNFTPF